MAQIHIRQVLALMDTYEVGGKPVEFSLRFIKESGEVRFIKRCAKGWKNSSTKGLSNFKYNVKSKDIVLIRDIDFFNGVGKEKGRSISVKIDGIIEYNGLNVFH